MATSSITHSLLVQTPPNYFYFTPYTLLLTPLTYYLKLTTYNALSLSLVQTNTP